MEIKDGKYCSYCKNFNINPDKFPCKYCSRIGNGLIDCFIPMNETEKESFSLEEIDWLE